MKITIRNDIIECNAKFEGCSRESCGYILAQLNVDSVSDLCVMAFLSSPQYAYIRMYPQGECAIVFTYECQAKEEDRLQCELSALENCEMYNRHKKIKLNGNK